MPEISVIVPVYNVEHYIRRCINSILDQSFTDFELILVDDGSPDMCPAICDEYAATDPRIKVLHQVNSGVSSARNAGMKIAVGTYIAFIDSDDWIDKDYLETFWINKSDLTLAVHSVYDEKGRLIYQPEYGDFFYESRETIDFVYLCDKLFASYCRLFRRDLIVKYGLLFPEGISWGEDGIFCAMYCMYIQNAKVLSYKGYHYIKYEKEESLSTKIRNDIVDTVTASREAYLSYLLQSDNNQELKDLIEHDICCNCAYFVDRLFQSKMKYAQKKQLLDCFLKNKYVHKTVKEANKFYRDRYVKRSLAKNNPVFYFTYLQIKIKIVEMVKLAVRKIGERMTRFFDISR